MRRRDGGDSWPTTQGGEQARVVPDRRNVNFALHACFSRQLPPQHNNSFLIFRPKKSFLKSDGKQETPNFLLHTKKHEKSHFLAGAAELTHARETTPNEFKEPGENSRLIDCYWSTFNDRNSNHRSKQAATLAFTAPPTTTDLTALSLTRLLRLSIGSRRYSNYVC